MKQRLINLILILIIIVTYLPGRVLAAGFSPTYSGSLSDYQVSESPSVTLTIDQDSGEDIFRRLTFHFPAGVDIKGSSDLAEGTLIASGSFNALYDSDPLNLAVTVRSYTQPGSKALWQYIIGSTTVNALLSGSVSSGHTLVFSRPPSLLFEPPLNFVTNFSTGIFTNPSSAGNYIFSVDMISVNDETSSSSWSANIVSGPLPPPPPPPPPASGITPPPPPPAAATKESTAIVKVAPIVTLSLLNSPSRTGIVKLSGLVVFAATLKTVEISLDNGANWYQASLKNQKTTTANFEFQTPTLDDDNYIILARATDSQGNIGLSSPQTLIVDASSPVIGGGALFLAGNDVFPDEKGIIDFTAGIKQSLVLSVKGGPTQVSIEAGESTFNLERISGTNLWKGDLAFTNSGQKELNLTALDGVGNQTSRVLGIANVSRTGKILDQSSQELVEARITVYFQDEEGNWLIWDGESYGQTNPQTAKSGVYSLFLPAGKYYIKVEAKGYRGYITQEFELSDTKVINSEILLTKRPAISILGLKVRLPSWLDFGAKLTKFNLADSKKTSVVAQDFKALSKFKLNSISGNDYSFGEMPTIYSFWSSWNRSSQQYLAQLEKVSKNVRVVAVANQDSEGAVNSFLNRGGYSLEVALDKSGALGENFGLGILPEAYFVDRSGKVREVRVGLIEAKSLLDFNKIID